jgi:hypothetical protein
MSQAEVTRHAACIGYLAGFMDGVVTEVVFAESVTKEKPPVPYSWPEGVELGEILRIVLKYIKDHPEAVHLQTAVLALRALQEAFPVLGSE